MNGSGLQPDPLEDLEELAAYIDDRLPKERRQAVEERLVQDPRYYQVFADTLRFQESEAGEGGGVSPFFTRSPFWRGVAAAAAAALAMAGALFLWTQRSPEPVLVLAASLDVAALDQADSNWTDPGWKRYRGAPSVLQTMEPEPVAFRLGVRMVDLQVHLQANDLEGAKIPAGEISNLGASPHTKAARPILRSIYNSLRDGQPLDLPTMNREIEDLLPSPEMRPSYAAGSQLELARLAALMGNNELLQQPGLLDLLEILATAAPTQEIQDRATAAAQILDSIDSKNLDRQQLQLLQGHLKHLVTVLGDSSRRSRR